MRTTQTVLQGKGIFIWDAAVSFLSSEMNNVFYQLRYFVFFRVGE